MSIDDHVSPHEMFLFAAVVILLAIRLLGLMNLSWWAITCPVWGYLALVGLVTRLQKYLL